MVWDGVGDMINKRVHDHRQSFSSVKLADTYNRIAFGLFRRQDRVANNDPLW